MSLARTRSWHTTVISALEQMKHSAQRRRGWKSEAEIHQTGTPEPHSDKKCQSYFQQSDNCGAIWSARVEEKDPFFQETGHPAARCRDFSHSSDSKGLWELAEGKDPRKKVSADRAHSMYGKQFNIFFMELSHRSWASLKEWQYQNFTLSHFCQPR